MFSQLRTSVHIWKRRPSSQCMELSGREYGLANSVWAGFQPLLVPSAFCLVRASLIAQLVKNLPAVQETPARFLGQKDLLEKG